ncbi:phenazine biosynthesis protein, PhzF family [Oesophagostomum dentatum]|uniref:Phenazine biosynthesis protein, PhzF family n=1 Tax=Oesophagostomum dentatum TaxID=61180 RepID=A0A0B1TMZ8_OESDE|nr:phenazine biosynthesis protein, PhzF family [Oesophagostomum dentatum]
MSEKYPTYIIDAFTSERFAGNQAAVCLIPRVLRDEEYRKIAAEFNLSETAFPIPIDGDFQTASKFSLRWFTPTTEVPLCGHATLGTSHILFHEVGNTSSAITFGTKSGELVVKKKGHDSVEMDFPQYAITSVRFVGATNPFAKFFSEFDAPAHLHDLIECIIPSTINVEGVAYASEAKKLIIVVDKQTTNFEFAEISTTQCPKMKALDPDGNFIRGVIVTLAPANAKNQGFTDSKDEPYDYVCRYFAPWVGITEDPATGSAQCALAPFWSPILGKRDLYVYQSYPNRGAQFRVQLRDSNRLSLVGESVTVLKGELYLNEAVFY